MALKTGRPGGGLKLKSREEIAKELGISERTVTSDLRKAEEKLIKAGVYEEFRLLLIKVHGDIRPPIRAGSIECRPEKWA